MERRPHAHDLAWRPAHAYGRLYRYQGCTTGALLNENLIAPLGLTRFDLNPGALLTVSVVVQNKGIAHSHVPEQRDMYKSWIDFTVKDAAGRTLAESGALGPDGTLDPGAHSFTNRLVNKNTSLVGLLEVWNNRVVAYNNTIQSGRSQLVRYSFTMPPASTGSVTVTAVASPSELFLSGPLPRCSSKDSLSLRTKGEIMCFSFAIVRRPIGRGVISEE